MMICINGLRGTDTHLYGSKKPNQKARVKRLHFSAIGACSLLFMSCTAAYVLMVIFRSVETEYHSGYKVGILTAEDHGNIEESIWAASKYLQTDFLFETVTCTESTMCYHSFMEQIARGTNNFILHLPEKDTLVLCNAVKNLKVIPNILSLSKVPEHCGEVMKTKEKHSDAVLPALVSRISQTRVSNAFFILQEDELSKKELLTSMLDKEMTSQVFVLPNEFCKEEWQEIALTLKQFPDSPILFVGGRTFFKIITMSNNNSVLLGRTIAVNLNVFEKLKLVKNNTYRRAAEHIYLITASDITERTTELTILKNANLAASEENILGIKILLSFLKFLMNDSKKLLETVDMNSLVYQMVDIVRLIPEAYFGEFFIQHDPWLRESVIKARLENSLTHSHVAWQLYETHSPVRIFTKDQIFRYSVTEECTLNRIKVSAIDPSWNIRIYRTWNVTSLPTLILIPNSNPKGFTLTLICNEHGGTKHLEIGCLGNPNVQMPVECIMAKSTFNRRRHIRSYKYYHSFRYEDQHSPENKLRKKDAFKNMLPQIGACVGATGGCSFCYVFLTHVTSSVSPSACFGSCAVGIGGSCASLMALGSKMKYQYIHREKYAQKYEDKYYNRYTVICSELYEQGYLTSLSYIADARFGSRLSKANPLALNGYQSAALPLVYLMRISPSFANHVFYYSLPWIRHMEFIEGIRDEDDRTGKMMTLVGIPACTLFGIIAIHLPTVLLGIVCLLFIRWN